MKLSFSATLFENAKISKNNTPKAREMEIIHVKDMV